MKLTPATLLLIGVTLLYAPAACAQGFNSGSNGSYGPINITTDTTLNVPADGIFHCTTITVASGQILRFTPNVLNTPVYLLATGAVTIAGRVDVGGGNANQTDGTPGRGGAGGFDGGFGGFGIDAATNVGSDGFGPGGGKSGDGSRKEGVFAQSVGANTKTYGNGLLIPLIGGSGGAGTDGNPGRGGGGGGGALLIASNTTITVTGSVASDGGYGSPSTSSAGNASGGAIRLVAPVVSGNGYLSTYGGIYFSNRGGPGRTRIDCLDRYAYRALRIDGSSASRGAEMTVFPASVPQLSIIEAAGRTIAEGTVGVVQVDLPPGSSSNRTVVLRGRNFTGVVPIEVVVAPESGNSTAYPAQIDMAGQNIAEVTVPVVIPVGKVSRIYAWTK